MSFNSMPIEKLKGLPKPFNKRVDTNKPLNEQVEIGMGCSFGAGSDSYPATIVAIENNGKTIYVTNDSHTPKEGFDYYSNQVYDYSTNWDAPRTCYTLRKNNRYIRKGAKMKDYWCGIGIGIRRHYHDPHF
jgi:hypothetical protein